MYPPFMMYSLKIVVIIRIPVRSPLLNEPFSYFFLINKRKWRNQGEDQTVTPVSK